MLSRRTDRRLIFELRAFDDHRHQAFPAENGFEVRRDVGSEIASVGDVPSPYNCGSAVRVSRVNVLLEQRAQGSERSGSVAAGERRGRIAASLKGQNRYQAVAVRVDQMEGDDRNFQFGHRTAEFFNTKLCRTKAITRVNARAVGVPEEVAMAFQVVCARSTSTILGSLASDTNPHRTGPRLAVKDAPSGWAR